MCRWCVDCAEGVGLPRLTFNRTSQTHLTFGKEFTQAVEQKQIAQQEAERAKFVVERSEQERQASVIRAEGEAEAATIISSSLNSAGEGLVLLRRIEAAKDIAGTMAKNRNARFAITHPVPLLTCLGLQVTYLPSSGGNMLLQVS